MDSVVHNSLALFKILPSDLKSAGKEEWQYQISNFVNKIPIKAN